MDSEQPKFVKNLRRNLLLMLVGFVVLIFLLRFVGYGEIFRTIALINIGYILLMIVTKVISVLIFNYKTYLLSKSIKPISFWTLLPIHMAGALVNNLTPGPSVGGEPLKAYYLEKATGLRGSICFGLYTMDSLIFLAGTAIFMTLSIFFLIFSISSKLVGLKYMLAGWLALFIILGVLLVLFILKVSKNKKRFIALLRKIFNFRLFKFLRKYFKSSDDFVKEILSKHRAFTKTLKLLWGNKKTLWNVLFASIIWYPLQALGVWFLFKGMGFSVSFVHLVAVITVSMSVGFIIFVPGGTGAVEATTIILMTMLGVPASAITAAILLDRMVLYVMVYLFGYLCLSYIAMIYTTPGLMYKRLGKKV